MPFSGSSPVCHWSNCGGVTASLRLNAGNSCRGKDVVRFLKSGAVQFVVADVGAVPRWIPEGDCFRFWKDEARTHLASDAKVRLEEFTGEYCYFASQGEPQ